MGFQRGAGDDTYINKPSSIITNVLVGVCVIECEPYPLSMPGSE